MTRVLVATCVLLAAAGARAQLVFEPEDPGTIEQSAPPPAPVEEVWSTPLLSFRVATRLAIDTGFEGGGENVVWLHRRLSLGLKTARGPWRVEVGARLRWVSSAEKPDEGAFLLVNGARPRSAFEPLPGETFVAYVRGGLDVTAGLLDLAWGQSPAFAAADVLTPLDLRDGILPSAESRLPAPAIRARGSLGPLRWEAVWLPVFVPSRLPLLGNDWGPFTPGSAYSVPDLTRYLDPTASASIEASPLATRYPAASLGAPQGGLRLSLRPGPFDVALSYAEIFDRQPFVKVSPALARFSEALRIEDDGAALLAALEIQDGLGRGEPPFSSEFRRARVVALDAAVLTGPVRWTLDAGFSPGRVLPTATLESVQKPLVTAALGLEFEGPPILAAGVMTMAVLELAADEQLLFLERANGATTARMVIAYLAARQAFFDDRLALELFGLVSERGDYVATPAARWRVRDWFTIGAGATLIGGRGSGFGARYSRNDEAFLDAIVSL